VDERRCYNTDATALQWPGGVLVESARKKMKAIHDLIVSATWKYLSHARPLPSEQWIHLKNHYILHCRPFFHFESGLEVIPVLLATLLSAFPRNQLCNCCPLDWSGSNLDVLDEIFVFL
jgi:hypothetical protein